MRLKYYILSTLLGFITFFPIFFSGFAGDDIHQLVGASFFKKIEDTPSIFTEVYGIEGLSHNKVTGYFYRPLTFTIYASLYEITEGDAFYFHLAQFIVYMLAIFLLYEFYRLFFNKKLAFLLSSIFFIHPANNELVAYIAALGDTLSLLFGIASIVYIYKQWNQNSHLSSDTDKKKSSNTQAIFISGLLIFLSLLSKESGILFAFMYFVFIVTKGKKKVYYLGLVFSIPLYFLLRFNASKNIIFETMAMHVNANNFEERIYLIVQTIYQIIKEAFVPTRNALNSEIFRLDFASSLFPVLVILIFSMGTYYLYLVIKKYDKSAVRNYLFFLSCTFSGALLYSQIIQLDTNFAPRWLYVTIIGILGMIGTLMSSLPKEIKDNKFFKLGYVYLGIIIVLYAIQTIVLNFLWLNWEEHVG